MVGQHDGLGGCLWTYCSSLSTFLERESHTVACLLKTVPRIMVGGIDIDAVTEFLQPESSVDYETFGSS